MGPVQDEHATDPPTRKGRAARALKADDLYANILYGVGGAAVVTGGLLIVAGFAELEEAQGEAGASILAGPDGVAVTWTASW